MKTNQSRGILPRMAILLGALATLHCGGDGGDDSDGTERPELFFLKPKAADTCMNLLVQGEVRKFTAVALQPDGSSLDVSTEATWSATDVTGTNVATLGPSGMVLGNEPGQTQIKALYKGLRATSALAVEVNAFGACPVSSIYHVALWGSDTCNILAAQRFDPPTIKKCVGSDWVLQYYYQFSEHDYYSMWGLDVNNIWVTGRQGHGTLKSPLVMRWDGTSWTPQSLSIGSITYGGVSGVWALDPNNVWAVGGGFDQNRINPNALIQRWDGSSWTEQPRVTPNGLSGVWGIDANNVWAVGAAGTIVKWDGKTWALQTSGTTQDLYSIKGLDANHVWVRGNGVALKWDGVSWKP